MICGMPGRLSVCLFTIVNFSHRPTQFFHTPKGKQNVGLKRLRSECIATQGYFNVVPSCLQYLLGVSFSRNGYNFGVITTIAFSWDVRLGEFQVLHILHFFFTSFHFKENVAPQVSLISSPSWRTHSEDIWVSHEFKSQSR